MADQSDALPTFGSPPVIETALSVQFAPLSGFTSAHFGWYWKSFLDAAWTKTVEAAYIVDQFERFGEQQGWKLPSLQFTAIQPRPDRIQFINDDDDRVIQFQNSRFIYNWRRREDVYPSFKRIYPEFLDRLQGFRDFLAVAGLGKLSPNQWEVTYVNHIPRDGLWDTPEDWHNVLPGLYPPPRRDEAVRFESARGEWHFEIAPRRGRLHVSCEHGKAQETDAEVILLQLTARGPIAADEPDRGLQTGLELGHRVLVQTFAQLASDAAAKHWKVR